MRIGIVVFEQVDLLDVGGPYEVFLTASRLLARDGGEARFEVLTVGATADPVVAYGGLRLIPQASLADCEALDVLVVPGVDAGEVVTSGGLSSGIAMSLHLVDRFQGRELAMRTARQIEYEWDPVSGART